VHRILVVEVDARIAQIVAKSLAGQGYEVVWAEDWDVGLFLGTTETFQAVILDIGVPGTPGIEVLRGIGAVNSDLPVIVLAAPDDPSSRQTSLEAGASGYLMKPLAVRELEDMVDRLVRRAGGASPQGIPDLVSPNHGERSSIGTGVPAVDEGGGGGGTTWVVSDRRYLGQRMPRAVIDWLREARVPIRLLVADDLVVGLGDGAASRGSDPWAALAPGDVVVARTRHPLGLALLRSIPRRDVEVLTPWEGVASVRNKPRAALSLAEHGIPTPPTFLAGTPAAIKEVPPEHFPLLLKPYLGDNARGIATVRDPSELDDLSWHDGMVLAQTFVPAGGLDIKVYVAGERMWAVRRPSPLGIEAGWSPDGEVGEADEPSRAVSMTPTLRRLATSCGALFGLELFGIDVLESPEGPVVVDVNEFPNYTGVPDAPEVIGKMVIARLRQGVRP
jgi:ribosomal protein S6--L-glutamate ligase